MINGIQWSGEEYHLCNECIRHYVNQVQILDGAVEDDDDEEDDEDEDPSSSEDDIENDIVCCDPE
jgi:hypothetical protein